MAELVLQACQLKVSLIQSWTVKWNVSGDDSDVAGWKVCRLTTHGVQLGEMPTSNCVDAGDATSVDVPHPDGTGTKTYYFAAVLIR